MVKLKLCTPRACLSIHIQAISTLHLSTPHSGNDWICDMLLGKSSVIMNLTFGGISASNPLKSVLKVGRKLRLVKLFTFHGLNFHFKGLTQLQLLC